MSAAGRSRVKTNFLEMGAAMMYYMLMKVTQQRGQI